jgi:hypothetical protein
VRVRSAPPWSYDKRTGTRNISTSALSATASAQRQYPSDVDTYLARERHAKCYVTAQDSAEAPATADHVSMDTYRELVNVVDC